MNRLTITGLAVWSIHTLAVLPSPFHLRWAEAILLLAAFVLVPLATANLPILYRLSLFASACCLMTAFAFEPSLYAALWTLPWFLATASLAVFGLVRASSHRHSLTLLTADVGFLYVAVGGAWAVASRLGYRPLDFEPVIVFLTAIHFHFAGFALPILASGTHREARLHRCVCLGAIAGVPLVAVGITLTQLRCGPQVEMLAALVMAATAIAVGALHLQGFGNHSIVGRLTGACLVTGGFLACLYGLRFVLHLSWLDIPFMRATHGTLNALGCCLGLWIHCQNPRTLSGPRVP